MRHIRPAVAAAIACAVLLTTFATGCSCGDAPAPARTVYEMDIVLEPGSLADYSGARLCETILVTVCNDSDEAWDELCFRDYMQPVQAEAELLAGEPLGYSSGVTGATCEDEPLVVHTVEGDPSCVYVALDEPLQPGEAVTVKLTYEADIPAGGLRCAWHSLCSDGGSTYELGQFYPMLAVYEDGGWVCDEYFFDGECFYTRCADFSIDVTVPEGFTVVASGSESEPEDGSAVWHIDALNMRDVTIIISDELELLTDTVDGVTVNSWYCGLPDSSADHLRQGEISLEAGMEAITAFDEAFGAYPYGELDIVESVFDHGGMEAPGLVRITALLSEDLQDEDSQQDRFESTYRLKTVVVHEIAHEWFYGVVGNDQFNEAWLDEGFASYSEQVYWRSVGRDEDQVADVMSSLAHYIVNSEDITIDRAYDELDTEDSKDYLSAVYARGAAFLYKLEQTMGQETFTEFVREYYAAYSFREADTDGFLALLAPYIAENSKAQALLPEYLNAAR